MTNRLIVNSGVINVTGMTEEDILNAAKDVLIDELDEQMDEIGSVLHDVTRGNSDYEVNRMERQLETLEDESERIGRSSTINNLRNLGYDIVLA